MVFKLQKYAIFEKKAGCIYNKRKLYSWYLMIGEPFFKVIYCNQTKFELRDQIILFN